MPQRALLQVRLACARDKGAPSYVFAYIIEKKKSSQSAATKKATTTESASTSTKSSSKKSSAKDSAADKNDVFVLDLAQDADSDATESAPSGWAVIIYNYNFSKSPYQLFCTPS
jgi:hypothetical protein